MRYPFLKSKVVLVEGPEAYGIYDLNVGEFQRVNKSGGDLLSSLDGLRELDSFEPEDRVFIEQCSTAGYVLWQPQPCIHQPTPIHDVLKSLRPVRFAWIEITSHCNQFCKHCFLGSDLNSYPPYTKDEVFDMLATLHKAGARQVIFSGGEPLAHPHISEILDHAGTNYPFKLSLLTNASHGRLHGLVDFLVKHEITVKVPLLGWGATHDRMAGVAGVFNRTLQAIESMTSKGVTVELGTTVTGLNHQDVSKLRAYANSMHLPLEVSPLYAVGYAEVNRAELYSISQQQILNVCTSDKKQQALIPVTALTVANEREKCTPVPTKPLQNRYEMDPTDYSAVDLRDFLTDQSECGQKIVAILSSREVTPCLMLRQQQHSLGSLFKNTLAQILAHESERAAEFHKLMDLNGIPGCGTCEARFACKAGGCPASARAFAGSVRRKNPLFRNCYYLHRHETLPTPELQAKAQAASTE